ncbi:MAG: RNA-binding protein [candidate division Zixibacteria bacterium]|nr:RNA-binding protein [candidate division Zixibacteria bacterium]MDH3936835.1 RNA-binding protein [candidate division Zixibacteria bacterium]MDH4033346.1 RNA-binding protein [candidate division Zixibacteria bacterium]
MNIYIGNLPFETTEDDLRQAFEAHGEVSSVQIIMDRNTGRSRGFAFVEMPDDSGGQAAIEQLNGVDFGGRQLKVTQANRASGGRPQRD